MARSSAASTRASRTRSRAGSPSRCSTRVFTRPGPRETRRGRPSGESAAPLDFLDGSWRPKIDYYAVLGVARTATRRRDQARVPQARPAVAPRRQQGPGRGRALQGDQRGLPGPVGPAAPAGLRHVRDGRRGGAPASRAAPSRSAASATSSTRSSAAPPGGAAGAAGRRPAPTCATTSGSPSRRRSPAPRRRSSSRSSSAARRAAGNGAEARHEPRRPAPSATAAARSARCARRCSARWSTSRRARAAAARARSSRRRARRATATAGSRSRTLRVTIPPGIDDGHQIRLSSEGEAGPRGGPKGSLYVAVTVKPHPTLTRDGTELYYELDGLDRPGRARNARHDPDDRGRRGDRDQGRARSPAPRSGCAAAACRTFDGPATAATST